MNEAYIQQMLAEWRSRASELSDWIMRDLVNRTDVWGRYLPKRNRESAKQKPGGFKGNAITAPFRDERGKVFLGKSSLEKHFKATDGGVLGIHSSARDGTSRWFAIDIDLHDEEDLSVTKEGNFVAAREWYSQLQSKGFDPLLLDSNGRGGFHLWVVLAEPMDSRSVRALVNSVVQDYQLRGLDDVPDLFPGTLGSNHLGSWLRLPGRHHSYPHYTRVYNDQAWDDRPWLEGHDAIDRLLASRPAPVSLLESLGVERKRKTVCLDFDGVIHSYRSGWKGEDTIPDPPIHGVREAIQHLRKRYRVVIHSSRSATESGCEAIRRWLQKHEIDVDDVCMHKPPAFVYVDDRAIAFDGNWDQTISDINDFRR
ncbi:MAG: TOTE conflict system archaeo-eukaryotic primase domain-containing protein [Rubripirellula sp.]